MRRTPLIALCLAAPAVVAAVVLGSSASAQSPAAPTLVLRELERGGTFTHIRNTKPASPRSNAQGDLIVFTNRLADPSDASMGRIRVSCVTTTGARDFRRSVLTCTGVLTLPDGTLTIQADTSPGNPTTTGAVTGGTGGYANARGVFTSVEGPRGSTDTITLVP